jgi:hypothetical protein
VTATKPVTGWGLLVFVLGPLLLSALPILLVLSFRSPAEDGGDDLHHDEARSVLDHVDLPSGFEQFSEFQDKAEVRRAYEVTGRVEEPTPPSGFRENLELASRLNVDAAWVGPSTDGSVECLVTLGSGRAPGGTGWLAYLSASCNLAPPGS